MITLKGRSVIHCLVIATALLASLPALTVTHALPDKRLTWCPIDLDKTPADSIGKIGCTNHRELQVPIVDDCRKALATKRLQDAADYFNRAARWDWSKSLVTGSDSDSLLFQNMYSAVLYKSNRKDEARQIAERALQKGELKEVGGADYTLGMLALEQGDAPEAEKLLRKHLETTDALLKNEVEITLDTGVRVSLPPDAGEISLTIDGKKRTLSKEGFALVPFGKHDVVLTSKRYKDFQQKVNIVRGEPTLLNGKLQLRPVTLNLSCDSPANARFTVKPAGGGAGKTGNGGFRSDVPEGQYAVHIEAPHYAPKDVDLTVQAGDPEVQKTYSLDRLAEFSIDTNGVDATFQLASDTGSYTGRYNQTIQDLKPGNYHLSVTPKDRKKYSGKDLEIVIVAGKPLVQPVTLTPAGGIVVLSVLNATDFQVEVDGSMMPSHDNLELPAGQHSLVLKARGYKDISETVTIEPGTRIPITRKFSEPHDRAKAQAYIQEGLGLLVHGQKAEAQKRADDALGEDAVGAGSFGLLALISLPNTTETDRYVRQALDRDKNDALALTARATLNINVHNEKARADLEQAVKANPNLEPAHALLGALYFQINKLSMQSGKKAEPKLYDLAEQQLETAISQDKQDTTALLALGKVYVTKGKYKQAVDVLTRAVNILPDPEPITVNNPKGECYAYIALAMYDQDNKNSQAVAPLEKASKYRFVGVGKSGHFDLYDLLKVAAPQ